MNMIPLTPRTFAHLVPLRFPYGGVGPTKDRTRRHRRALRAAEQAAWDATKPRLITVPEESAASNRFETVLFTLLGVGVIGGLLVAATQTAHFQAWLQSWMATQ